MLLVEKLNISKVSEFSILPYTQNRKTSEVSEFSILFYTQNRNLGKCSFTSNCDRSCNLRCKNDKKLTEAKTQKSRYAFYQYKT